MRLFSNGVIKRHSWSHYAHGVSVVAPRGSALGCVRSICPYITCSTTHAANCSAHFIYSWIARQMDIGTTLASLLLRSNFKSETSFGFLSPNYTGQRTYLIFLQNLKTGISRFLLAFFLVFLSGFQGFLGTISAI